MLEITEGFTHISAGADRIENIADGARAPTGVRVVVEFCRELSLTADQQVVVRYDFAGDGNLREGSGIARHIRTVVLWGRAVLYHYRLSYWIAPTALRATPPLPGAGHGIRAADPSPV